MPNVMSEPYTYGFIDSGLGVHLGIQHTSPFLTLCGFQFEKTSRAVVRPGRIRFGTAMIPFRDTRKRVVTCPRCVEIVRICQTVEVDDRLALQEQQKS